jgi:general secretion pathway protein G
MKQLCGGFTLIELLVTLALVGIAASVALPLASVIETRAKETELRRSLRTIRQALDNYKTAADSGAIDKTTGTSGYPPSLEVLVSGVPRSAAMGFSATPMIFLRSIPRDPFYEDRQTPAAQTWNVRGYGSKPGDIGSASDVFDVSSKSEKTGLDGTKLSDW